MNMQPASRSLKLSPIIGDHCHRFVRHHVPLALASAVVLVLFMGLPPFDPQGYSRSDMGSGVFPQPVSQQEINHEGSQTGQMDLSGESQRRLFILRVTDATGYVATGLLGLTLLIGPANLLLRRRNPVSSYLTRDVGTWAAIFSVVHVIFGLEMHGSGRISGMLNYFVADGRPLTNSFGLANWTGLAATVIVVGLLAISRDFALRKLKARTWKDLQRLNYTLFVLVILHVFFYGALLRMTSSFTLLGILIVIAVVAGQAVGVWLWPRRDARTTTRLEGAVR